MSVLDGPDPEDPLDSLCDYCDASSFVSCCLCDAHLCRKHNRIHKCRPEPTVTADQKLDPELDALHQRVDEFYGATCPGTALTPEQEYYGIGHNQPGGGDATDCHECGIEFLRAAIKADREGRLAYFVERLRESNHD